MMYRNPAFELDDIDYDETRYSECNKLITAINIMVAPYQQHSDDAAIPAMFIWLRSLKALFHLTI